MSIPIVTISAATNAIVDDNNVNQRRRFFLPRKISNAGGTMQPTASGVIKSWPVAFCPISQLLPMTDIIGANKVIKLAISNRLTAMNAAMPGGEYNTLSLSDTLHQPF